MAIGKGPARKKSKNGKYKPKDKRLQLLAALVSTPKPDISHLESTTKLSRVSIHRYLKRLREDYKMNIEFVPEYKGQKGKGGYYQIRTWGIISKAAFYRLIH